MNEQQRQVIRDFVKFEIEQIGVSGARKFEELVHEGMAIEDIRRKFDEWMQDEIVRICEQGACKAMEWRPPSRWEQRLGELFWSCGSCGNVWHRDKEHCSTFTCAGTRPP